ncbi:MAG: hypothetical protein ABIP63_04700 [Thermoanaerobaculia bacterium]
MSDDSYLERLRGDAAGLRYEPEDPATWTRLSAQVRARIRNTPQALTASQLLANWFRPVVTSLAAVALVAALGIQWFENSHDPVSVESVMVANNVEISVDGDIYSVAE